MVSFVGMFVDMDASTKKKKLDVGRVLVSTPVTKAINKVLKMMIIETIFPIRIMEDVFRLNMSCIKFLVIKTS